VNSNDNVQKFAASVSGEDKGAAVKLSSFAPKKGDDLAVL